MKTSYDPKCLELAEYFYPTATRNALDEIAQRLQETIEDFADTDNPEIPHSSVGKTRE